MSQPTESCCRKPRPQCGGPAPPPSGSDGGGGDDDESEFNPHLFGLHVFGLFVWACLSLFGLWFTHLILEGFRNADIATQAIKSGLEQRVVDGKVIWVRVEGGWKDPAPE